jgi:hypothetical protein
VARAGTLRRVVDTGMWEQLPQRRIGPRCSQTRPLLIEIVERAMHA